MRLASKRPEEQLPAALFYNDIEAKKYNNNTRMIQIQNEISHRCIDLLKIPDNSGPKLILDIGCGSGLSGHALEQRGHFWIGTDISRDMLNVAGEKRISYIDNNNNNNNNNNIDDDDNINDDDDTDDMNNDIFLYNNNNNNEDEDPYLRKGDLIQHDMGFGLPFGESIFDGCISVSALQWLCHAENSEYSVRKRLTLFFESLYNCLKKDASAALQFYPKNPEQAVLVSQAASRVGFTGGVLVDFPNSTKAKKYYLCLSFQSSYTIPQSLDTNEPNTVNYNFSIGNNTNNNKSKKKRKNRKNIKDREWIMKKKEKRRMKGRKVKRDSKYTGRRRKAGF